MLSTVDARFAALTPQQLLAGEPVPVLDHGYLRYVAHLGDDLTPLEAARMSTGNATGVDTAKDAATRDYLWRHAHATPFEMAVLQIEVQVPIFVAREWHRHRTQSFNEASGRYMEMPSLYYQPAPNRFQQQSTTNKQGSQGEIEEALRQEMLHRMQEEQELVRNNYKWYLANGLTREVARIDLPLSQYTRFRAQANLRNWLHFLKLRMAENAQYEIRMYAHTLAKIVAMLWPETWAVFVEHTLEGTVLSRTELQVLRQLLLDMLGDEQDLAQYLDAKLGDTLPTSRKREFLGKLGIR